MNNKINLNPDGYYEIDIMGDQSSETMIILGNEASSLIDKSGGNLDDQILALIDFSNMGKWDSSVRTASAELFKKFKYKKIAIIGASFVLKELMGAMLMTIGKHDFVKIFSDKNEAIKWLLEK